jgi:hypothetical protein
VAQGIFYGAVVLASFAKRNSALPYSDSNPIGEVDTRNGVSHPRGVR